MKRHFTGKRKANAAVEPKAETETETPTRRVAPRVSYGQLESEVPAVVAPSPAEVPAVDAPSPAPAATPPILDEPVLAAAMNQWKEEEHGRVTSAGAAEVSTLVEVDRLRQQLAAQEERLAAQERRNAEWQRINLDMLALTQRINVDMLALTQRVMAMAAEGDGGGAR